MMRTWFEPLPDARDKADCAILNRAARNLHQLPRQPTRKELMYLATSYRKGMSAADLIELVEGIEF